MPTKSRGCATCRKRKIRCDETRPACNRCKTHGVPCPGYRLPAPGEVRFQDQTEWTVLRAPQGPQSTGSRGMTRDGVFKNGTGIVSLMIPHHDQRSDSAYGSSTSAASSTKALSPFSSSSLEPDEYGFVHHETNIDFATAMALYASPTLLPSPAIEKQLIYSTFLETYLPKSLPHRPRDKDGHFSMFQHLINSAGMRSEVADSLDALSLVQVGSLYKDKALLKQAVKSYSKALRGLVRTLSSQDFVQDDYVLATCTILSVCEFFDEIAQVGNGWSKHMNGNAQLMAARGPDSVRSDLALLLFANMKHSALSYGLIARKACFLGLPEWRAVAWRDGPIPSDASTMFYDIALQVPAVLEKFDRLDREGEEALEKIEAVLQEALRLQGALKVWFRELQTKSKFHDQRGRLYWLTDVSNFPVFAESCKDRTVEEAYMFPGFMMAYIMSVYWNNMYFLRTTVQSLHILLHRNSRAWFPKPEDAVTDDEILTYVMNACRCFPFFCEPSSSSAGQIGMFLPMFVAATYFQRQGNWKMLKWLGNVRDNVFTRGMRPPSMTSVPTALLQIIRGEESVTVGS